MHVLPFAKVCGAEDLDTSFGFKAGQSSADTLWGSSTRRSRSVTSRAFCVRHVQTIAGQRGRYLVRNAICYVAVAPGLHRAWLHGLEYAEHPGQVLVQRVLRQKANAFISIERTFEKF